MDMTDRLPFRVIPSDSRICPQSVFTPTANGRCLCGQVRDAHLLAHDGRGGFVAVTVALPALNDTIAADSVRDPITPADLEAANGCARCAATFGTHNGPTGTCPDHGHEYAYAHDSAIHDEVGPGQTRHACPEPGCPRVKWYS